MLHLLHSSGDIISFGWPLFLNIIGAINNSQGYYWTNLCVLMLLNLFLFFSVSISIMKREFNSFSIPMFTAGGYGLSPCFAMELSAFSSWDDWKIWIANAGSQRLSYGHWFDGKGKITLLCIKKLTHSCFFLLLPFNVFSGIYPTIFIKTEKYYVPHCVKKEIRFFQTSLVCQIWLLSTNSGCASIPNLVIIVCFEDQVEKL